MKKIDPDWFLNEALWEGTFPFMFPDSSFAAAVDQVQRVIALTGCSAGAVLDLGCGAGRHAVPFSRHGFSVTGVDCMPFFLEKAGTYATAAKFEVKFLREDMRQFVRPESFDLAISMFSSFGYFEKEEDNRRVIENAYASLKPGGKLLIEMMGKEVLARTYQHAGVQVHEADVLFQQRHVMADWTRIRTDFYLVSGGTTREFSLQLWLYSGRELKTLLLDAGFRSVELYGSLDGTPYDPSANRLIAVAMKKAG